MAVNSTWKTTLRANPVAARPSSGQTTARHQPMSRLATNSLNGGFEDHGFPCLPSPLRQRPAPSVPSVFCTQGISTSYLPFQPREESGRTATLPTKQRRSFSPRRGRVSEVKVYAGYPVFQFSSCTLWLSIAVGKPRCGQTLLRPGQVLVRRWQGIHLCAPPRRKQAKRGTRRSRLSMPALPFAKPT